MKHKLYGSVLIIGGGLSFPGAAAMLQARLELQLPTLFTRSVQTVEVFATPRVCVCVYICVNPLHQECTDSGGVCYP